MSKHSVIILGLHVVTTCWSWAWTKRTSPSNGVGLGSPLVASSVYWDLTCSVHTVNNLCLFNCQWHAYLCNWGPYVRLAYMPNMLSSWNKVIIIIIIFIIIIITWTIWTSFRSPIPWRLHMKFNLASVGLVVIEGKRFKNIESERLGASSMNDLDLWYS